MESQAQKKLPIKTYRDLDVFQLSYSAALKVSGAARRFPGVEQVELARQLRRAARSVPANIVEGWAKRSSPQEFKRYLPVAIGSCHETMFWLEMSTEEGYLSEEAWKEFRDLYSRTGAMLQNLWKRWRNFAA